MDTSGELLSRVPYLETKFPDLADYGYEVTSDPTSDYNCIAWAAGDAERWWWPSDSVFAYWPDGVPKVPTLAAFQAAYQTVGYALCEDEEPEVGFEKIAIYAGPDGTVMHAARHLDGEFWTSKMGHHVDMRHPLRAVEGSEYGRAVVFMRRPRPVTEKAENPATTSHEEPMSTVQVAPLPESRIDTSL